MCPDAAVARLVNSGEEPWAGVSVQNLDAAGMLVRGDAARWDAETRLADAADAEKRSISEAHPAVIVTGYWSMPSKHGSRGVRHLDRPLCGSGRTHGDFHQCRARAW